MCQELLANVGQYSATQEDDMGQLYLSNIDFLKNGVPASIIATLVRTSNFEFMLVIYNMVL